MRVLHVISSVRLEGGGPIEGVISGTRIWQGHGYGRHILSLDSPGDEAVLHAEFTTFAVGTDNPTYKSMRRWLPWLRYGYTPGLKAWLDRHAHKYDAIIINGLWNYASFGAWRSLHKQQVPYFVFTHGMLDPWFNRTYRLKTFFKSLYWKLFENKVLRDSTGVFFTCEEERQLARTSFQPYAVKEYVVGYGAADVAGDEQARREAFRAIVPRIEGRRRILFLSRIHPKKGVDLLIEAFGKHKDALADTDLVIAGPDQVGLKAGLAQRAAELGIAERIFWPGMLRGDAKYGAFLDCDYFVLPSHQENFGIAVAEALALARPVLITNQVNIWREIEADGAGLVVNDDVDGVAGGLLAMAALTPEQLTAMGTQARRTFEMRYDLRKNAVDFLELIASIIGKPVKVMPSERPGKGAPNAPPAG